MDASNDIDLCGLHKVLLMMAKDFDDFCREHSICYYLMGGTALGAIRHGGFIPWDDDFDVFMDLKNYKKFLKCASNHLNTQKYYLQIENTNEWPLFFSKIRLNETIYREGYNTGPNMHEGIFIDIMCLNYAFNNKLLRYLQYLAARFLSAHGLAKLGYRTNSRAKWLTLLLSRLVGIGLMKRSLLWLVRSAGNRSTFLLGHFFGRAPFGATSFETSLLGRPRYVEFEKLKLPVPEHVEHYLSIRYGDDYFNLPSDEERARYSSHAVAINLGSWASVECEDSET